MQLGPGELAIILVIVLIIFGAGKLPQVFSSLGKGVREFREAAEGKESTQPAQTTQTAPQNTPSATRPSTPPAAPTESTRTE
jgi:sec-independent protein translocase protein TatA